MASTKKFFYKDKTGRGIVNNDLSLKTILSFEDEEDWNDQELHEWAKTCEVGDKWENRTTSIVRIN